ncbi:hypothetical protein Dsin_032590 [Dipteronia sinensis]|uniref:RNase H type-1 domain-containing protein n=1 Tax=Dipteronia sinensis TaxID=43782 RepID=A0AAD9ZER7_9ROSI|nr:hypothetical protein Dsin_032590 [Dipteronia sinensis]
MPYIEARSSLVSSLERASIKSSGQFHGFLSILSQSPSSEAPASPLCNALENLVSAQPVATAVVLVERSINQTEISRWKALKKGVFKINIDAAVPKDEQKIGVGIVMRNELGLFAMESGLMPFVVESNALNVVKFIRKVNSVAHSLAKMALSIDEDMFWLQYFPPCEEMFVLGDYLV